MPEFYENIAFYSNQTNNFGKSLNCFEFDEEMTWKLEFLQFRRGYTKVNKLQRQTHTLAGANLLTTQEDTEDP